MNEPKNRAWSLVKAAGPQAACAVIALSAGVFLRWFAKGYGATDAAPLMAYISFATAAVFLFWSFVETWRFLKDPIKIWAWTQVVAIWSAVVGFGMVLVTVFGRFPQADQTAAWGTLCVTFFLAAWVVPNLKPRSAEGS